MLAGAGDVVISDALNHASIIDGCRAISKEAARDIYRHADMADLARVLDKYADKPGKIIVTDGVFSMEGDLAPLPEIVRLAKRTKHWWWSTIPTAWAWSDPRRRGTVEHYGLLDHVDIHTGTLGKALGGGAGGYVAGPRVVIDSLIQRSRPHLFSNAVPPSRCRSGARSDPHPRKRAAARGYTSRESGAIPQDAKIERHHAARRRRRDRAGRRRRIR